MFGYVRPVRTELRVWEWERYREAYCGLCDAMGRRHGFLARMFLNYDFTFLAMLLLPDLGRKERSRCRCPARLGICRKSCTPRHEAMDLAADESVILAYWKLRDGVLDGSFWQRQCSRILSRLLRSAYRRAQRSCPAFAETVENCLGELHVLEREQCPSLDRTADTFARILSAAGPKTGSPARDRAMEQLLYHVGRWIYLLDAWDDLEEDRRAGQYNPILKRFPDRAQDHREEIERTLLHSRNLAVSAYALLDGGDWSGILENILYLGLPAMERSVFAPSDGAGRWNSCMHRRMDR